MAMADAIASRGGTRLRAKRGLTIAQLILSLLGRKPGKRKA
jgi:hypothetical protein